jgi:hypothetical protein
MSRKKRHESEKNINTVPVKKTLAEENGDEPRRAKFFRGAVQPRCASCFCYSASALFTNCASVFASPRSMQWFIEMRDGDVWNALAAAKPRNA